MVIYSAIFSIVIIIIFRFVIPSINRYSDRFLYLQVKNKNMINLDQIKKFYNKKLNSLLIAFIIMIAFSLVVNQGFSAILNYLLLILYFVFVGLVNSKVISSMLRNFPNAFYDNTIRPYGGLLSKATYF